MYNGAARDSSSEDDFGSSGGSDGEDDPDDLNRSSLEPFVPMRVALRELLCNLPRLSMLALVVVVTVCGMVWLPAESFKATYKGGSNNGIANTATWSACVHYCEKTYLDESGFGEESIGGRGICGADGDKVDFCLFKSEVPSVCTRVTSDTITEETMVEYGHSARCSFKYVVPHWQPYFVIGGLVLAITLIIQGLEPEVALLGTVAVYTAAGVLTTKEAAAGFASSSVIALALLLPVAKAIEETGLLDRAVSVMLGQPGNFSVALVRMMLPVALLSAGLSNTAIVAMLIPVIVSWSRRLDCHAGKLMMPLSFAAQLGGRMTLIGSSHCLVAREAVSDVYSVTFFSTTPAAFWLLLVTMTAILFLAPTPLLRHSLDKEEGCCPGGEAPEPGPVQPGLVYNTTFVVQQLGALEGAEADSLACTLMKLPGVKKVAPLLAAAGAGGGEGAARLRGGDHLQCVATEDGIVALRQARGIEPQAQPQLTLLGARRKERALYACAVADPSKLPLKPSQLRWAFGCALIAARRPGSPEVPWSPPGQHAVADIRPGDVLLLEADPRYLRDHPERWFSAFSVVNQVKDSSPPRNGYRIDSVRAVVVCVGMLILIILVALEIAHLSWGCGLFLLMLLAIKGITLQELYGSIKVSVIFTIVGAFGMSKAMQKTGVANFIADVMMTVFEPLGSFGLCAAVYIVSVFLSMWISNSATVAIVGNLISSIVPALAAQGHENIDALTAAFVWILICGAGSCFTTPLGYQTNMMVMPDGRYSFPDFFVFGGPVTLVHAAACIFTLPMMAQWIYS